MNNELSPEDESLLQHIDEGTRQLREGQYTEYNQEGLRAFFDEVQSRGTRKYEESQNRP